MFDLTTFHDWTYSLGWTALHSLWQFTIVAILCSLLLRNLRKSSAEFRFWIGYGGLLLCLAIAAFTFVLYLPNSNTIEPVISSLINPESVGPALVEDGVAATPTLGQAVTATTPELSWWENSWLYLNAKVHLLGIIWTVGLLFFGLRFGLGILGVRRLRREGLEKPSDEWLLRFQQLLHATRSFRGIGFSLSNRVNGPVTIGFLRPLVLLPVGLLAQLPPDQIEAILLHEIAHVRRHDYLLNLIQRAILAFFFYQPAVHIIGRWIDRERENACDDFAVQHNNNPRSLVRALAFLSLQPSCGRPQLALAATGPKGQILPRLNRLIDLNNSKKTMNANRFFLLLLLLPVAGLLLASRARPAEVQNSDLNALTINMVPDCPDVAETDSVPPSALERHAERLATIEDRLFAQEERLREQEELLRQREDDLAQREAELQEARQSPLLSDWEGEDTELISQNPTDNRALIIGEGLLATSGEELPNRNLTDNNSPAIQIAEDPLLPRFVVDIAMEHKLDLSAFGPEVDRHFDPVTGSVIYTAPYGYFFSLDGDRVDYGQEATPLASGDYKVLHAELREMLIKDQLMEVEDCVAILHISPGNLVINDQALRGQKARRYEALLQRYDIEKAPGRQIRIERQRLKIGHPGEEESSWIGAVWFG